jgi:glutamine amidotransferase
VSALLEPPVERIAGDRPSPLIGIVDYGMGNLRSVEKAFEHVGARVRRTSGADALRDCDGLVLPGVGAFPRAIANLRERGLDDFVREAVAAGTPTLGICLGMQLAFERSEELGGAEGLGLLAGDVRRLDPGEGRLPHIGWNAARFEHPSPLREGLPEEVDFYHVHTFVVHPSDPADVLATVEYGERFATAVERGSFAGVQFHPEKSSTLGLRLLANFATVCAHAA